jgi:1,4-dihydroxy-2-naphthoate octaprenyltransferase
MDFRTLVRILRIEGLIPFTGCAILLGFAVTVWETGFSHADWLLFVIAAVIALLIHIDAHIWNDIMDLAIDRQEKSRETGRDRPLVFGWATVGDYRKMSVVITVLVVILTAFLTIERIFIPFLVLLGFVFDYGYNHPRFALAHRAFTEWYIFPWLVVAVTVTVVYAATGVFSMAAFILSLLNGLVATCFVVSMMRRDFLSDRIGMKYTSSVKYPGLPHSTLYGIVTLTVAFLVLYPLSRVLGSMEAAYFLVLATVVVAGIDTFLGAQIDQLCTRAMYSEFPGFESEAHKLMIKQVKASLVYTVVISIMIVVLGGVP